jgi:hypothetical protein
MDSRGRSRGGRASILTQFLGDGYLGDETPTAFRLRDRVDVPDRREEGIRHTGARQGHYREGEPACLSRVEGDRKRSGKPGVKLRSAPRFERQPMGGKTARGREAMAWRGLETNPRRLPR